jgi:hypothetical protein
MTKNMMTCPECGAAFDTVAQEREPPCQRLDQQCPDCDYDVTVGIVNYPDGSYEVIAPALPDIDTDCTVCGDPPTHRIQRVGNPLESVCIEHIRPHQQAPFDIESP